MVVAEIGLKTTCSANVAFSHNPYSFHIMSLKLDIMLDNNSAM